MLNNLINGNISDAKAQAKRFSLERISNFFVTDCGWDRDTSWPIAGFLKTGQNWQEACDALDTIGATEASTLIRSLSTRLARIRTQLATITA